MAIFAGFPRSVDGETYAATFSYERHFFIEGWNEKFSVIDMSKARAMMFRPCFQLTRRSLLRRGIGGRHFSTNRVCAVEGSDAKPPSCVVLKMEFSCEEDASVAGCRGPEETSSQRL
jgi:hypothetical protein